MNRRAFFQTAGTATIASLLAPGLPALAASDFKGTDIQPGRLPRWRGFNLLEKFTKRAEGNPAFSEADFQIISDWGFNFVRLPMSYLCWSDPADWRKFREPELEHIDSAIELGRKYGIHVNLNFHRAPGYCVNPPAEPLSLWNDEEALEVACLHWAHFSKRYKGISNSRVSFDLLNEPPDIEEREYVRVAQALVGAIRAEDPNRLIIADGLRWGRKPVHGLASLGLGQSTRGYDPMEISHYKANWIHGSEKWPEPIWPLKRNEKDVVDQDRLRKEMIQPWKELEKKGVGVHVGEWGVFNRTPHAVGLAWMRDLLGLWKEAGWGWALWELRGSFGVLNSRRDDVQYEDFRGHKLDRKMLDLLKEG